MKVNINIDRAAAIRAGREIHGTVAVEVDLAQLSASERAELAAAPTGYGSPYLTGMVDGCCRSSDLPSLALDGTEDPVDAVRAVLAARRAIRADRVVQREAEVAEAVRTLAANLPQLTAAVEREEAGGEREIIELHCPSAVPSSSPLRQDLQALALRRDNARQARAEAVDAAAAERAKAELAALRDWAQRNGSALLVARIAGEYSWRELARKEFFSSITPPWYAVPALADDEYADRKSRTVPELDEIEALATARSFYPAAELGYVVVHHDHDHCDEDCDLDDCAVVWRYVAIVLTLTAPDGTTLIVERKIKDL